jgi:hypothetical protein
MTDWSKQDAERDSVGSPSAAKVFPKFQAAELEPDGGLSPAAYNAKHGRRAEAPVSGGPRSTKKGTPAIG